MRIFRKTFISAVTALAFSVLTSGTAQSQVLWIGDLNGNLGTVDVATGTVTVVGYMGLFMYDIAFDPSGQLYAMTNTQLYRVNTTTAQSTLVGTANTGANSLVFGQNGWAYAASNSLFEINSLNGAVTPLGNGGTTYQSGGDLAFVGGVLYLAGDSQLYKLNTTNGAATLVGNIGYSGVYGLASPDGVTLYGVAGTKIIKINTATGAGTFVRDYSGHGLGTAGGTAFRDESHKCGCFDISVEKFRDQGTFHLRVRNEGTAIAGSAKVEVVDVLPAGLTIYSIPSGTGWTCTPSAPVVGPDAITCTYLIPTGVTVAPGQWLPDILLSSQGTPNCPNCARARLYQTDTNHTGSWTLVGETDQDNNVSCAL